MKRAKRMAALVLAGSMLLSNIVYAEPVSDTSVHIESEQSLNPNDDAGGAAEIPESVIQESSAESVEKSGTVNEKQEESQTEPQTDSESEESEPETADESLYSVPETQTVLTPETETEAKNEETQAVQETEPQSEKFEIYDVSFEMPQNHGAIFSLNNEKFDPAMPMKTDETGKAQFKVIADDGYEVDRVVNKADQIPLNLTGGGYYEIVTAQDTVIEVYFNKLPEKDAAEDDDHHQNNAETQTKKQAVFAAAAVPPQISSALLNDELAGGQFPVIVVDENGNKISGAPETAPAGICAETGKDLMAGYDFVRAEINNAEIYSVGLFNGSIYYVPEIDHQTGILLGENETIIFKYEKHVETYPITYNTSLDYDGPTTVKDGKDFSFTAQPSKKGQKLSVTVNGSDISEQGVLVDAASGKMMYTVSGVHEAQNVAISEVAVTNYVFTYDNSKISNGNITWPDSGKSIEAGGSITFGLESAWNLGQGYVLNLLAVNGVYVNVPPTSAGEGAVSETELPTGEKVTVKLIDDRSIAAPVHYSRYYEATISNVYTDIEVTHGNFKADDRKEIILKQLDGVDSIIGWDYASNNGKGAYIGGSLNKVFLQTKSSGNEFYFDMLPGYAAPKLKVLSDGKEQEVKLTPYEDLDNPTSPSAYDYQFNIGNNLSDNIEVFISAEKQQYKVEYYVQGEKSDTIKDDGSYTIFSGERNQTLIGGIPEYDSEKYVFEGWEYNGKTYQPNEIFTFDEKSVGVAEDGVVKFTAKLTEIKDGNYVPYTVKYLFQNDDYSAYEAKSEYPNKSGYGIKDSTLFLYDVLQMQVEGYVLNEEKSEDIKLELNDETSNIAEVYFDQDKNSDNKPDKNQKLTISFNAGDGSFKEGVKTQYTLLPGDKYPAAPEKAQINAPKGKAFDSWKPAYDLKGTVPENQASETKTYTAVYGEDTNGDGTVDDKETKYAVKYESGVDDESVQGMPETVTGVLKNTEQTVSEAKPSRTGYVFAGWETTDVKVENGKFTMPGKDVTFTAMWEEDKNGDNKPDKNQKLTISFSAGEGSFKEGITTQYTLLPGATYPAAPEKSQINAPAGKAFDSWTPVYDLKGTVPKDQKTETKTYTAVYGEDTNGDGTVDDKETKYAVKYESGVEDESVQGMPETVTGVLKNTEQKVSEAKPSRTDYVFAGWETTDVKVENGKFTMPEKDVTFTAVWEEDENNDGKPDQEQKLTISFSAGEGSFKEGITTEYTLLPGDKYPTAPEKSQINAPAGKAFDGWKPAYDLKGKVPENQAAETKTYTAVYGEDTNGDGTVDEKETKYAVKYESGVDDESVQGMPETVTGVLKNTEQKVSEAKPSRTGYVFAGWETTDVKVENGKFTMPAKDVTFTAAWEEDKNNDGKPDQEQKLTISFSAGDGSFKAGITTQYTLLPGDKYPAAPEKSQINAPAGKAFDGWKPAYDLKGKVPENQAAETKTYTAVYGEDINGDGTVDDKETKYAVKYESGVEDESVQGIPETVTDVLKNTEQKVSEAKPSRTGYVFDGWETTDVKVENGKFIMPGKDVTFTAVWEEDKNNDGKPDQEQKLTISFSAGDGKFKEGVMTEYTLLPGDTYPAAPEKSQINAPAGKAFDGWTPAYDLKGTVPENQKTETKTYTAVYGEDTNGDGTVDDKETKYAVKYESGVEDESVQGIPETITGVLKNTEQKVSEAKPSRTGYVFASWETTDVKVENGKFTMPGKDVTFTATWEEDKNNDGQPDQAQKLTISFSAGDGSFKEGVKTQYTLLPGDTYPAAPEKSQINAPSGKAFDSWKPAYDLKGTVPENQAAETKTYTAVYGEDTNGDGTVDDKETKYAVKYESGVEDESVQGMPETITGVLKNTEQKVSEAKPSRTGYVFAGWETTDVKVENGKFIMPRKDVTFTAVWEDDKNGNGESDKEEAYSLTITYSYAENETGNEELLPEIVNRNNLKVGETYSVSSPKVEAYVAVPEKVEGTIKDSNVNETVFYYRDENGNGIPDSQEPDNPDTPDNPDVPDTPDTPDNPDVPDTPDMPDNPDVPDTPDTPDNPNVPDTPDTPDNPSVPDNSDMPDNPSVPADPTVSGNSGTGNTQPQPGISERPNADNNENAEVSEEDDDVTVIDEDEVPLGEYTLSEIDEETAEPEDTTVIDEEDTPLGKMDLNENEDKDSSSANDSICILHFIIFAVVLILLVIFGLDVKKRQTRINNLKKKLKDNK